MEGDHFMQGEFFPFLVCFGTPCTDELATVATETSCGTFFAFLTLGFLSLLDFLKGISDLEKVSEVECALEARNTSWREKVRGLAAVGTAKG